MPVGSNFSVLSRNCLHFNLLLKEQKPIFRGKKSCLWFLPLPVYVFPSHLLISLYTAAWGEGQLRVSSQLLWGEHIPQTKFGTRLFSTHFFFLNKGWTWGAHCHQPASACRHQEPVAHPRSSLFFFYIRFWRKNSWILAPLLCSSPFLFCK